MVCRLIAITGVTSLLNSIAVLRHLSAAGQDLAHTVLISDLSDTHPERRSATNRVIQVLAERSGHFDEIVWLPISERAQGRQLARNRNMLRHEVSCSPDEVFVVRNWQPLNEAVLNLYPAAKRHAIGDSFGFLDLRRRFEWPPAYRPLGYRAVDATFSILRYHHAVDKRRDSLRLSNSHYDVSPGLLLEAMKEAAEACSKIDEVRELRTHVTGGSLALLSSPQHLNGPVRLDSVAHRALLSFSQRFGILREVAAIQANSAGLQATLPQAEMYANAIRGRVSTTTRVILKPHPRGWPELTTLVAQSLTQSGYEVIVLTGFPAAMPTEVLLLTEPFGRLGSVITLGSHTKAALNQLAIGPARIE